MENEKDINIRKFSQRIKHVTIKSLECDCMTCNFFIATQLKVISNRPTIIKF